MHGQQRSDPPSMGVEGQSHSPPGPSTSPPHGPTDPWTLAHTAPPTCRLRVRRPGTAQRCTHTQRARGSQDATPAPLLGAHSGMQSMTRGAVSADPRGSCHQPRSYHVSPAKCLRRTIFCGRTRHAVDPERLGFSLYKCTPFDILAVLYTCTTVASRVASNACATHLDAPAAPSLHAPHNTRHLSHVPDLGVLNPWCYNSWPPL